jgi:hypothetical protein
VTTIPGVGPQLQRAAAGLDPRGVCTFEYLPDDLQRAEDSTNFADHDRRILKPRGFTRPATDTERALLEHLGYGPLPEELLTSVTFKSRSVRHRAWPALESQEVGTP